MGLIPVGSADHGLQVGKGNEWDFNILLKPMIGFFQWLRGAGAESNTVQPVKLMVKDKCIDKRYVLVRLGDGDDRSEFRKLGLMSKEDDEILSSGKVKSALLSYFFDAIKGRIFFGINSSSHPRRYCLFFHVWILLLFAL